MTAVERLIEMENEEREFDAQACRLALTQALSDEIDPKVLAEATVDFDPRTGRSATLTFAGYVPISVYHEVGSDGIPEGLRFSVWREREPIKFLQYRLVDALVRC
jgi:hypothetical protein